MTACLLVTGCGDKTSNVRMKPADVDAGFPLSIPSDYAAVQVGDEVRVYLPARERSRSAVNITVSRAASAPTWKNARTRRAGKHDVHYVVRAEDGGSGGPALRLVAWTFAQRQHVLLESVVQPDVGGDGEFRAEWAILAALP